MLTYCYYLSREIERIYWVVMFTVSLKSCKINFISGAVTGAEKRKKYEV